jgi:N-acetylglucosamine-6-sulfatase
MVQTATPTRRPVARLTAAVIVLGSLVALSTAAVAGAPSASAATVGPNSPNVLLVNLDDARYDAFNYMPKARSWLFGTARRYLSNRVTIPSCCPSRSSMFTGRYSHNNGVKIQTDATKLDKDYTLMRYLKDAGYLTGMSGKFLVDWPGSTPPPYFDKHTVITGGYYNYSAWVDSTTARTVSTYSTTFLASQLRSYLTGFEAQDSRPWFAYYAPQAPHVAGGWKSLATPETKYASTPVATCAKPGEADRSDKPQYLRWVAPDPAYVEALCESQIRTLWSVDDELDRIFTQLKSTGELADTLIIVTSDNGNHWGEQSWFTKFTPYEAAMRVPLVVRWDGQVTAGTDTRMTSAIDLLPTILGILGRQPAKPLDGRSILSSTLRVRYFSEYFLDTESNGPEPTWASLMTPTRKYVENYTVDSQGNTTVFREFYRLDSDPGELVNILHDGNTANDPSASTLATWANQLAAARTCAGSTCP